MSKIEDKEVVLREGKSHVTRGGTEVNFLEYVSQCDKKCIFWKKCKYVKGGICSFEARFYGQVVNYLLKCEREGWIDEVKFIHVSMSLMPLYRQLLLLYKEEIKLGGQIWDDDSKVKRMHPVYNEIRRVIKDLGVLWKNSEIRNKRVLGGVDFGLRKGVFKFAGGEK